MPAHIPSETQHESFSCELIFRPPTQEQIDLASKKLPYLLNENYYGMTAEFREDGLCYLSNGRVIDPEEDMETSELN